MLRHHLQLRLRATNPRADLQVLPLGTLEVIQVLLQRGVIELGQELRLDRDVDPANVVDELTFIHGVFTFAKAGLAEEPLQLITAARVMESDKSLFPLEPHKDR